MQDDDDDGDKVMWMSGSRSRGEGVKLGQGQGGRRGDVHVVVHVERVNNGSLVASVIPSSQLYSQVVPCSVS